RRNSPLPMETPRMMTPGPTTGSQPSPFGIGGTGRSASFHGSRPERDSGDTIVCSGGIWVVDMGSGARCVPDSRGRIGLVGAGSGGNGVAPDESRYVGRSAIRQSFSFPPLVERAPRSPRRLVSGTPFAHAVAV